MIGFVVSGAASTFTLIALTGALSACSAPSSENFMSEAEVSGGHPNQERQKMDRNRGDAETGVANLPYARGKVFNSLDEYLTYLEETQGPIDKPWWREIKPGLYEHMIHMPGAERETATREELMERYGFTR